MDSCTGLIQRKPALLAKELEVSLRYQVGLAHRHDGGDVQSRIQCISL